MNFSENWDEKEKKPGVTLDITIESFALSPEEYLVIIKDAKNRVFDITTEVAAPPRTLKKDFYYKFGIDRCPACSLPYENKTIDLLQNLNDYEELEVHCSACGSNHVYFKKGQQFDLGKVRKFLDKHLK